MTQAADVEATSTSEPVASEAKGDEFDFFQLPRPIQDRLLASVTGSGAPRAMLFHPTSAARGLGAIGIFVVSASLVLGLAVAGFGALKSSFALQGMMLTPVYGLFGGVAAVALAAYAWMRSAQARYPYRFGNYLFPAGVLVVHREKLRWHRVGSLLEVSAVGSGKVKLRFSDAVFTFPLPSGVDVEHLEQALGDYREKLKTAYAQKDRRALAALDPLRDSGFSNPLSSHKAMRAPRDQRPWRYALALLLGATIGILLFFARNKLGERALYERAVELNTAGAYEDYLARGGSRQGVAEIFLPRARLGEIKGDLVAVEEFSRRNADSKIRAEIDLALREVLLEALDSVKKEGTLAALSAFEKTHPEHEVIKTELAVARHAVFDAAYKSYLERFGPEDEVAALFRAMVTFSEKHGPEVEVRFRRKLSDGAKVTDNALRRSAYFAGNSSLPSQYFEAEHAEPREKDAAAALVDQLQKAFPSEVLKFVAGENAEYTDELPAVQKPTLFISYRTTLSGGYTTNRPRNVYVGIGLTIYGDFVVPESDAAYDLKYSKWLPPDINAISRENLKPVQVYDANARKGLELFQELLLKDLLPVERDG